MPRIVSLIASATEIVCALGLREYLVGRSHECDFPAGVARLPKLTRPNFDVGGTSRQIDRRVKGLLKNALSIYAVDERALKRLAPDVIVTQDQCAVCAVSLKDVERAACALAPGCRVVSLKPDALSDVWSDIRKTAAALGAPERGRRLVASLRARMAEVARKARRLSKPRLACLEWLDPLMAAGNWMPELAAMAGGVNLFGKAGKHSPWMSAEALVKADPDVIVAIPCGFDLTRTRKELKTLARKAWWRRLKAVRAGRVYAADGNQYFNRPGPRLADSAEILAEILHPQAFPPRHRGRGWSRF